MEDYFYNDRLVSKSHKILTFYGNHDAQQILAIDGRHLVAIVTEEEVPLVA